MIDVEGARAVALRDEARGQTISDLRGRKRRENQVGELGDGVLLLDEGREVAGQKLQQEVQGNLEVVRPLGIPPPSWLPAEAEDLAIVPGPARR